MEETYKNKLTNCINALDFKNVKGDGVHDDTEGLQAALDTRACLIYFPKPQNKYIISRTLVIYSGQTLMVDRAAVIHLADWACAHMLTNSDHIGSNQNITVIGGIWDGNNTAQTCDYHKDKGVASAKSVAYDPDKYIGVLLRFNNVTDLRICGLTLKDPECYGMLLGNLLRFTIEDITFDYNRLKYNM